MPSERHSLLHVAFAGRVPEGTPTDVASFRRTAGVPVLVGVGGSLAAVPWRFTSGLVLFAGGLARFGFPCEASLRIPPWLARRCGGFEALALGATVGFWLFESARDMDVAWELVGSSEFPNGGGAGFPRFVGASQATDHGTSPSSPWALPEETTRGSFASLRLPSLSLHFSLGSWRRDFVCSRSISAVTGVLLLAMRGRWNRRSPFDPGFPDAYDAVDVAAGAAGLPWAAAATDVDFVVR